MAHTQKAVANQALIHLYRALDKIDLMEINASTVGQSVRSIQTCQNKIDDVINYLEKTYGARVYRKKLFRR
jgi:hypothetical protein